MRYSEKDLNVQQIKSIQRITGSANVPDTGAGGGGSHSTRSTDVTISAVDTDKTFLIVESYMVGGSFTATEFYADIEGHPKDPNVARALAELNYFTSSVNILGVYPSSRT